jgi:hypothetical protein
MVGCIFHICSVWAKVPPWPSSAKLEGIHSHTLEAPLVYFQVTCSCLKHMSCLNLMSHNRLKALVKQGPFLARLPCLNKKACIMLACIMRQHLRLAIKLSSPRLFSCLTRSSLSCLMRSSLASQFPPRLHSCILPSSYCIYHLTH